jgi:uncharacterized protein YecT (DUF1311 family)
MRSVVLLCFFIGILAVTCICSAAARENNPCVDLETQAQINACAAQEYSQADAELNRVYGEVISSLTSTRRTELKRVQQVWIKYRDAHCQFVNAESVGGSMYPVLQYGCLTTLTKTRTAQLTELLESSR